MKYLKITPGFVVQSFDDEGKCYHQAFIVGEPVEYETEEGDIISSLDMPLSGDEHFPYDMVQPSDISQQTIVDQFFG